jgi:uncharacterized repeat protein (TIGR03803 family)
MSAEKHLTVSPCESKTISSILRRNFTRARRLSIPASTALLILFVMVSLPKAEAVTSRVIHHFNSHQGVNPEGVVIGPDGNLYGVTLNGSSNSLGGGTVFELAPAPGPPGRWLETKLFDIVNLGNYPNGHLIFDSDGNLYGTTQNGLGGVGLCGCCVCGWVGTVFELSPAKDGTGWHGTLLANFYDSGDAGDLPEFPISGLVRDSAGNLYGAGGGNGEGDIYELTPASDGTWTAVLNLGGLGYGPNLTLDAAGNLYGTGLTNGAVNGLVFKLDTSLNATTLYSFTGGADGGNPEDQSNLIFDAAGNLYGTTQAGGANGLGTVFELSPNADGSWSEKVIHSFNHAKGYGPTAGLIMDAAGNLYGEAYQGGNGKDGVVFKLAPDKSGHWEYTPLRSFHGPDGNGPSYGLAMDGAGNLYGTTWSGGTYGNGTVFEITP